MNTKETMRGAVLLVTVVLVVGGMVVLLNKPSDTEPEQRDAGDNTTTSAQNLGNPDTRRPTDDSAAGSEVVNEPEDAVGEQKADQPLEKRATAIFTILEGFVESGNAEANEAKSDTESFDEEVTLPDLSL